MFDMLVYPFFAVLMVVMLFIDVDNLERARNVRQKICAWLSLILTFIYPVLVFSGLNLGFIVPFSMDILFAWFFSSVFLWLLSNLVFIEKGMVVRITGLVLSCVFYACAITNMFQLSSRIILMILMGSVWAVFASPIIFVILLVLEISDIKGKRRKLEKKENLHDTIIRERC